MEQKTSPEPPGRQETPEQNGSTPSPTRVEELIRIATELSDEVEDLALASGHQFVSLARTARINRRLIWISIVAVSLNLILLATVVIIGVGMAENTRRIDALAQRVEMQQTVQRQRALCPLYGIFLDSKSVEGRKRAPDPEKYDHAFEVIEDGYDVLGCAQYLKESGRDAW